LPKEKGDPQAALSNFDISEAISASLFWYLLNTLIYNRKLCHRNPIANSLQTFSCSP
jgi:hypothetical protein